MKNARSQLIFAFLFSGLILVGLYFTSQINLAFSSDLEKYSGPRAYPAAILGVMLVLNLCVIANAAWIARTQAGSNASTTKMFTARSVSAALFFAVVVLFSFVFESAGYLVTMIPLLVFTAYLNGGRRWTLMMLTSVLLSLACLLIFRYGLNTVLPEGVFGIDGIL